MRSNNKVSFVCKYHVVWCPKYRRQVLVKGADIRLEAIIRDVCRERSAELIEVEVMPDAVVCALLDLRQLRLRARSGC
ncbi:MAG TPA: IS200/IS605 family transposase [Hyphomicrobiaceae bacterium]|nr:IS200/IS605 family transposase [Hyphomicrobiaceae bacterium]